MSLELLEHEFALSLLSQRCHTCELRGIEAPATHVAVYRQRCAGGGELRAPSPDFLVCRPHAAALEAGTIGRWHGEGMRCGGCLRVVSGEQFAHILERVEPIRLPR
jgi:hypothetical protein